MRLAVALSCLALLAPLPVAASVVAASPASAARVSQCTLPVYRNHTPHPLLRARLNRDRTVTLSGRTCPWAFIAVFQVHGHHLRNNAEDLVCDANPDRNGDFSCSSLRRYPNGSSFGVMISGQFIVNVAGPGSRSVRVHRRRPSSHHTVADTGFGGLARLVARHHPWRPARTGRSGGRPPVDRLLSLQFRRDGHLRGRIRVVQVPLAGQQMVQGGLRPVRDSASDRRREAIASRQPR
jgi:hypothetical protein